MLASLMSEGKIRLQWRLSIPGLHRHRSKEPPVQKSVEPPPPPPSPLARKTLPSTKSFRTQRSLNGSFQQWLSQTFVQEEAARKIQGFVRRRWRRRNAVLGISSTGQSGFLSEAASTFSIESVESDDQDTRQSYDIFLWHGTQLGLEFYACNRTGFPCVQDSKGNESLPGMWNLLPGDYLISINYCSTHQAFMEFDTVLQILEDGVRPAVLRFRRPRGQERRGRANRPRRHSLDASVAPIKREQQRRRERLERSLCYVVWREEDGPLGIVLKPDRNKPYPSVSEVNPVGVVARETQGHSVRSGDLLLSINHMDVSVLGYRKSLDIMKFAPRPLVLTFRRNIAEYPYARRSMEL